MIVQGILAALLFTSDGVTDNHFSMKVTGYENNKPYPLYVSTIYQKTAKGSPHLLSLEASRMFRDMSAAAAKDGFFLKVLSSYRTHREQIKMKKVRGEFAAPPGWSSHQRGLSVDIHGTTRIIDGKKNRTILYWWLVRNARKFGFYNDVEKETWHWTYYGKNPPRKVKKKKTILKEDDENV